MISPELLRILRCPIDPERNSSLTETDDALVCSRCAVRFRIKEGLPNLIADEAELPAGCAGIPELPCQTKS